MSAYRNARARRRNIAVAFPPVKRETQDISGTVYQNQAAKAWFHFAEGVYGKGSGKGSGGGGSSAGAVSPELVEGVTLSPPSWPSTLSGNDGSVSSAGGSSVTSITSTTS